MCINKQKYKDSDLIARKFNMLTIVGISKRVDGKRFLDCLCDCGNKKSIYIYSVISGVTNSCGCLVSKRIKEVKTKHGERYSVEYNTYRKMIARCYNKNNPSYKYYNEKNIKVCDEWLNSFELFLKDMGRRPSKEYSIDRINNNENYSKENCRWATKKEQIRNRSNTLKFNGIPLIEHCEKHNLNYSVVKSRINRGDSLELALRSK